MTTKRIIELLEIEHRCMTRGACNECNRDCGHCDLVQDDKELDEMYKTVINIMKKYEELKKQHETLEPKIISLEEVSNAKLFSTVYLESYFDGKTSLEAFIVDIYSHGEYVICNCRDMFYTYDEERLYKQIKNSFAKEHKDTKFRFWNALPSNEQRREVKWE